MLTEQVPVKVKFSRKWFNPLYFILLNILKDNGVRTVLVYGGKSSAKTVSISQLLTREAFISAASSIAFRKETNLIQTTLKKSFNLAINSMRLRDGFDKLQFMYRCLSGAEIVLKGLDDPEKAKGIESYKYVYLDELNHFEKSEFEQFNLSLRGIEGQKIFASWNPVSETSWVKTDLIDSYTFTDTDRFGSLPDKDSFVQISQDGSVVLIKTTYLDNYWTVGSPEGDFGYRDENLIREYEALKTRNLNAYLVNVKGEWGKVQTGGEFLKHFDATKHIGKVDYVPGAIYACLDENVNPYITNTIWQVNENAKQIKQIHEIMAKSPDNNAPKAAGRFADYLNRIEHKDIVFVCGDPSASKRSTVDENSASFYTKFIEVLTKRGYRVVNKVMKSAPEVALSGAFINEILEHNLNGWSILISDKCLLSIQDYAYVKEDAEGKLLKEKVKDKETGVTYEKCGHALDTLRYEILTVLAVLFQAFKGRRGGGLNKLSGYFR